MARKNRSESCPLDMTPMIDVVFQLMIFFIVTINLSESTNPEIKLEKGPYGTLIDNKMPKTVMTVEVDKNGRISMNNLRMDHNTFRSIVKARYNRIGEFPLLIRGDYRTKHQDIRKVMDMCTELGLYKVWFAAIQKETTRGRSAARP
jgi:biopolymer transport protein ExbD